MHSKMAQEIWYDLLNPSQEKIKDVEQKLHISIPTDEERKEIEYSSRLYEANNCFYMTVNLIAKTESKEPISAPVTFILSEHFLVTLRHIDPKPFQTFAKRVEKNFKEGTTPLYLFLTLLEIIVDRIADILEAIGTEIDMISQEIFQNKRQVSQRTLKELLAHLGQQGDLSTKVRLSLENINRLLKFINAQPGIPTDVQPNAMILSLLQQDLNSIADHNTFLFHKINFLLDASLGQINIEQNNVIRILSVAAVVFLPPMLISSIYGMNFEKMPELYFKGGYLIALLLMALSSFGSYLYFKKRRWL